MSVNSGEWKYLTGFFYARRRHFGNDLLTKAKPNDAAPVIFTDLLFAPASGDAVAPVVGVSATGNVGAIAASGNVTQITQNALTVGSSNTSGTSFSTASVTPTANRLILLTVYSNCVTSGNNSAPNTVALGGLNFTLVGGVVAEASWGHVSIWRAMSASPPSGTISITFPNSRDNVVWSVSEFVTDTSGTNGSGAIVQTVTSGPTTSATSMTTTLAAYAANGNGAFSACTAAYATAQNPAFNEENGWTEIHDRESDEAGNTWTIALETIWRDNPRDTTATHTPTITSASSGAIAVELKALVTSSGNATAPVTGVVATSAVGTINANGSALVTLPSASANGVIGTITARGAATASIVGVGTNGNVGIISPTAGAIATLTGVSAASQVNSINSNGNATATLTGVSATAAVGIISATGGSGGTDATAPVTGVSATSSVGNIAANGSANVVLIGVNANSAVGLILPTAGATKLLNSVSATGQVGAINATGGTDAIAPITGVNASGNTGAISARGSAVVYLFSNYATGQVGNINANATSLYTDGPRSNKTYLPRNESGVRNNSSEFARLTQTEGNRTQQESTWRSDSSRRRPSSR